MYDKFWWLGNVVRVAEDNDDILVQHTVCLHVLLLREAGTNRKIVISKL